MNKFPIFLFFGSIIAIFVVIINSLVAAVIFDRNCGGRLERAATANTIQLATQELEVAVKYLEDNKMTEGYTSVLWRAPDEDVGFWYTNLKESFRELESSPANATRLETSNALIKLRETLTDRNANGSTLVCPTGISRYPCNTNYAIIMVFNFILLILSVIWMVGKKCGG